MAVEHALTLHRHDIGDHSLSRLAQVIGDKTHHTCTVCCLGRIGEVWAGVHLIEGHGAQSESDKVANRYSCQTRSTTRSSSVSKRSANHHSCWDRTLVCVSLLPIECCCVCCIALRTYLSGDTVANRPIRIRDLLRCC